MSNDNLYTLRAETDFPYFPRKAKAQGERGSALRVQSMLQGINPDIYYIYNLCTRFYNMYFYNDGQGWKTDILFSGSTSFPWSVDNSLLFSLCDHSRNFA
jgi:hypothetical protein